MEICICTKSLLTVLDISAGLASTVWSLRALTRWGKSVIAMHHCRAISAYPESKLARMNELLSLLHTLQQHLHSTQHWVSGSLFVSQTSALIALSVAKRHPTHWIPQRCSNSVAKQIAATPSLTMGTTWCQSVCKQVLLDKHTGTRSCCE